MQIQPKPSIQLMQSEIQRQIIQNQILDTSKNQYKEKLRKIKRIAKKKTIQRPKKIHANILNQQTLLLEKKPKLYQKKLTQKKPTPKIDKIFEIQAYDKTKNVEAQIYQFFNTELYKYLPKKQISSKQMVKQSKKNTDSNFGYSMEEYNKKCRNEVQIKVINLLQNKEQYLFLDLLSQNLDKYQNQAQNFLLSVNEKILKNGNNIYIEKQQQKSLKLLLQKKQYKSSSFFLVETKNVDHLTYDQYEPEIQTLSLAQKEFIEELKTFNPIWQKQINRKLNQSQNMKQIAKPLLVLAKCYKNNKSKANKIKENISSIQEKQQQIQNSLIQKVKPNSNDLQLYIKCLIKKSLIKSFNEKQNLFYNDQQIWNFFKFASYNQQNVINQGFRDHQQYLQIQSQQQYKDYMKRIKNKKIIYKPSLYTNCKACFSNHFEKYNPILKCPQCKFRVHRYCGKIQQRCDRCNYKKLGASMKAQTPKCFICSNQSSSLMLIKIKGSKFAHNFCLLVHNLWNISNQKIIFDLSKQQELKQLNILNQQSTKSTKNIKSLAQVNPLTKNRKSVKSISILINQDQENQNKAESNQISQNFSSMINENQVEKKGSSNQNQGSCKFCQKQNTNSKLFLKNCQNCNKKFHIICAYLNGCQIEISEWKNSFDICLKICCCSSNTQSKDQFDYLMKKRIMNRKYKLNYEKFAFNYGFEYENTLSSNAQSRMFFQDEEEAKLEQNQTQKCAQQQQHAFNQIQQQKPQD